MKSPFASKTLWLHVLSGAILMWNEVSPFVPENIAVKGAVVVNAIAFVLRFFAGTPLKLPKLNLPNDGGRDE